MVKNRLFFSYTCKTKNNTIEELRSALDKERCLVRQIQRSVKEVKQAMRQKQ